MPASDTIFALSSAPGRAGVAVFRVSGPAAKAVLRWLGVEPPPARRAVVRKLVSPVLGVIDEALILSFDAPASFTGEDVVEIQCHGGAAVKAAIVDAILTGGLARLAEPGEFSRRAFENGKLDLTGAEGLADLINAETEAQRAQAIGQTSGRLRQLAESWRSSIIAAQALVEAAIDFSDEADVPRETLAAARAIARGLAADLQAVLADGRRGEILREGFRVVLAGPPNVGKSSLLNALAKRDVAIVSDEAGTTRDVIEVKLDLDGIAVLLTDTAGLRATESKVEREGIRRTVERAGEADLVLWLIDSVEPVAELPPDLSDLASRVMPVVTKADLMCGVRPIPGVAPDAPRVSVRNGRGISELLTAISRAAASGLQPGEPALITRARHRQVLEAAHRHLEAFISGPDPAIELRAEDLRLAASAMGRITGAVDAEDVLGAIFSSFCIGK